MNGSILGTTFKAQIDRLHHLRDYTELLRTKAVAKKYSKTSG